MSILSPFVGSWNHEALDRWCAAFSGAPERVALVWIEKGHPWAVAGRWLLPKSTWQVLTAAGASLLRLRRDPDDKDATDLFHEEHRLPDDRWSHAKVYALQRGNSRRVLVTSANFSPAAWGAENRDGELMITNFELGVCVEQTGWPFADLEEFDNPKDAATVAIVPSRTSARIIWARAAWDGKRVEVECRCEGDRPLTGKILAGGEATPIRTWTTKANARLRSARVKWVAGKRPPASVQLTCGDETVNVPVFDERPSREREDTMPPEVDADIVQAMRDDLLFEQYGGLVDTDIGIEPDGSKQEGADGEPPDPDCKIKSPASIKPDSYAVPASELARRHFLVVDNWASHAQRIATLDPGDIERRALQRDGELLVEAFRRQALRDEKTGPARAIGAKLAAEELEVRLKHLRET